MSNKCDKLNIDNLQDLLNYGQSLLTKHKIKSIVYTDENITGIEDQLSGIYLEQMIKLNKYMFTVYSTNIYEHCLSVEGFLKLSVVNKIIPLLKEKGLWYTVSDVYDNLICYNIDDNQRLDNICITHDEHPGYKIHYYNPTTRRGWFQSKGKWHCEIDPHFHCRNRYYKKYINTQSEKSINKLCELKKYCCIKFLQENDDPLVALTVEDPVMENKNLYIILYDIFYMINV
jgi:hypothetical protein